MKISVLVVDDSALMRMLIAKTIEEDAALSVAGVAKNGEEALRMAVELNPDVITMDVEMPVMNGLQALQEIMKLHPTPVIMLSTLTNEGAKETVTALSWGAVDFVKKPSGSISLNISVMKDELVSKIKMASKAIVKSYTTPPVTDFSHTPKVATGKSINQIVAIGTSTGGPRALEAVLTQLPSNFPHPIVIVQHMPPVFTNTLAQRLNQHSNIRVVEATDNQRIQGGIAYIAPGGFHMEVVDNRGGYTVVLHQEAAVNGFRPSVDVLFQSISKLKQLKRHFVIMTGMGSDGAKEMHEAKLAGATSTIAESEETSTVFGMPKAAIELGCVDYVVPVQFIAKKILSVTRV
jgi:two-component system, chemotaxis family, protein-glutamate methylesterase/glutaminase